MAKQKTQKQRFLLVQVIGRHDHAGEVLEQMAETESLVATYGGVVIEKSVQHRIHPDPATYIGEGKVEWLKQVVREKQIEVVVVNDRFGVRLTDVVSPSERIKRLR